MLILDPGHSYEVEVYDVPPGVDIRQRVHFMKREGPGYPGNIGTGPGTNCQELLRVLIDRVEYLNKQKHTFHNHLIIEHLQNALWQFEYRAAKEHGLQMPNVEAWRIQDMPTCKTCGHVVCTHPR